MPIGRGRRKVSKYVSDAEYVQSKPKSFVFIKIKDKLCIPRALAVGISLCEDEDDPNSNSRRKIVGLKKHKKSKAKQYCTAANLNCDNGGGIEKIQTFLDYYKNYQITVIMERTGKQFFPRPCVHKGAPQKKHRLVSL